MRRLHLLLLLIPFIAGKNFHWKYEEMPQTDSKEASGAPLPDCAHWSRSDPAFFATILFIEKGKLAET